MIKLFVTKALFSGTAPIAQPTPAPPKLDEVAPGVHIEPIVPGLFGAVKVHGLAEVETEPAPIQRRRSR